jgi:hypothetical protein
MINQLIKTNNISSLDSCKLYPPGTDMCFPCGIPHEKSLCPKSRAAAKSSRKIKILNETNSPNRIQINSNVNPTNFNVSSTSLLKLMEAAQTQKQTPPNAKEEYISLYFIKLHHKLRYPTLLSLIAKIWNKPIFSQWSHKNHNQTRRKNKGNTKRDEKKKKEKEKYTANYKFMKLPTYFFNFSLLPKSETHILQTPEQKSTSTTKITNMPIIRAQIIPRPIYTPNILGPRGLC